MQILYSEAGLDQLNQDKVQILNSEAGLDHLDQDKVQILYSEAGLDQLNQDMRKVKLVTVNHLDQEMGSEAGQDHLSIY